MARPLLARLEAATLIVLLTAPWVAAAEPDASASLSGVVVAGSPGSPLAGARLLAGDPSSGRVYPSAATAEDGRFELGPLPPGRYELAVAVDDGLFLAGSTVSLAPGAARSLRVSVARDAEERRKAAGSGGGGRSRTSLWNNPFTAGLIVLGSAIVVGIIVDNATDDDDAETLASPF